ncbi:hypothetical protein Mapa_012047 [Marchantia paleacea]|nr:hypothetical protein Mapa_012047 [Marchantia paleacea]
MDMAMVNPGLARFSSPGFCASFVSESSPLGCSGCRLQLWRTSLLTTRGLREESVGRQSNHGTICRAYGERKLSHKESSEIQGDGSYHKQDSRSSVVAGAIPSGVTAVATLLTIGGSLYALLQLNKDKIEAWQSKKECQTCSGSGLCPTCDGEGFNLRNLSAEAAAKARANAKDAATRYTAGLAKKWNYCTNCQGARGCPDCQGRGWVE